MISENPHITIGWWNVQNLFSYKTSELSESFGFTPEKGWTKAVYQRKLQNLAQAIHTFTPQGPPDLLGLGEIENEEVLADLALAIGKPDYKPLYQESKLTQGFDTAFLYNHKVFDIEQSPRGYNIHTLYSTNDILEINLKCRANGAQLIVLANHWPSRKAGILSTEPYRISLANHCAYLISQHLKFDNKQFLKALASPNWKEKLEKRWQKNLILIGDFNDEPFSRSIHESLLAIPGQDLVQEAVVKTDNENIQWKTYRNKQPFLYNPLWELMSKLKAGTYYYSQLPTNWAFLDQAMFSKGLLDGNGLKLVPNSVYVVNNELLSTASGVPRPFHFSIKSEGTSDHLPIVFSLEIIQ